MLGNIKFKYIESLKNMRAEEYDYDKFLSDSSDDYPKYEDLVNDNCKDKNISYNQVDDYWFYCDKFNCKENNLDYTGTNIALAKSN